MSHKKYSILVNYIIIRFQLNVIFLIKLLLFVSNLNGTFLIDFPVLKKVKHDIYHLPPVNIKYIEYIFLH